MSEQDDDNEGQGELKAAMEPEEFRRRRAQASARREGRLVIPTAETAAMKHGLYSQRLSYLPCDVCQLQEYCEHYQPGAQCPLERGWMEYRRPLVAQAMRDAGRDPELHAAQITAAVHAEIRYLRNWGYLLVDGEVRPDPKQEGMLAETPSSKRVERLRHQMDKAFEELGLSPMAMAKLESERQGGGPRDLGMMMVRVEEQERRAREGVVDVEFEAAETAGNGESGIGNGETATAERSLTPDPSPSAETTGLGRGERGAEKGGTAGNGQGAMGNGERHRPEDDGEDDDEREAGDDRDDAQT